MKSIEAGIDKLVRVQLFLMGFVSWMFFSIQPSINHPQFIQMFIKFRLKWRCWLSWTGKSTLHCVTKISHTTREEFEICCFFTKGVLPAALCIAFFPRKKHFQMIFYWNITKEVWSDMPCAKLRLGLSEIEVDIKLRAETSTPKLLGPLKLFIQVFLRLMLNFLFRFSAPR